MEESRFHWADYLIFALTLAISTGVGIYFGCTGKVLFYNYISKQIYTIPRDFKFASKPCKFSCPEKGLLIAVMHF